MKNNTTLLYGIIGLLVGVLATTAYFTSNDRAGSQATEMDHHMTGTTLADDHTDMSHMMDDMMAGLDGKTGDAFDKAFLSEMIVHHQGAVVMAEAVLKNSKRPELIKLANDIIKAQTTEINMMKGWESAWFSVKK